MEEHTPKEVVIAEQLQRFTPRPSQDAYQHMANAPWYVKQERKFTVIMKSVPRAARLTSISLLVAIIAGAIVWAMPTLRSFAQELLDNLFNRAESTTIVVEPIQDPPPVVEILPSVAQTFYALDEAEAAIGMDISTPQTGIAPFELSGITVNHESQTVWLIYNAPERYLSVYQRAVGLGWLDEGVVGPEAAVEAVEFVNIAGFTIHGEYVAGAWQQVEGSDTATWTMETTQKRLRWQDDQWVYEMVMFGSSAVTAQDMIAIAASMQ